MTVKINISCKNKKLVRAKSVLQGQSRLKLLAFKGKKLVR